MTKIFVIAMPINVPEILQIYGDYCLHSLV